ncbi:aldose epimerase family protein [Sphingomonas abietis]|uniref:Aldose 1-epimerase n=1 Tax=Sphingomonas abietis TaxID=3012344 RepID=A0ABY7NK67_9SPHN|nr:aldose epimerase family protein [Sphingomonas abietis]WBO21893.1 galactose mutarotase [Sphingomonas abietis]
MNDNVTNQPDPHFSADILYFGERSDGGTIEAVELADMAGTRARILTMGASLQALEIPDRDGRIDDVVLGFDDGRIYESDPHYFGSTIGRYANRIASGRFTLDERDYVLATNDGAHHLHGGADGFHRKSWRIAGSGGGDTAWCRMVLDSPDGDQGYPGALQIEVLYMLSPGQLAITYSATTDRPTVVGITNHAYFNLAGAGGAENALGHVLTIAADAYLPTDEGSIPTGERRPVAGSPFDFRTPAEVGRRIRDARDEPQLAFALGYDHNFVLRDGDTAMAAPRHAATLHHPGSGRTLDLFTDAPGLQFYTGNHLRGTAIGKGGRAYRQSDGLCLEPQPFPDSPNRPDFPSVRLDPGEVYRHRIAWRFAAA